MKRAKKRTHERMDADGSQKDGRADGWMDNASVNFSCSHPPPGQPWGICAPCQSREWCISKFGAARGSGNCLPRGYPRAFDTHVVSHSKSKHGGIYRKGPAVRQIGSSVKVEDWTNLKRFSRFYAFLHCLSRHDLSYRERST